MNTYMHLFQGPPDSFLAGGLEITPSAAERLDSIGSGTGGVGQDAKERDRPRVPPHNIIGLLLCHGSMEDEESGLRRIERREKGGPQLNLMGDRVPEARVRPRCRDTTTGAGVSERSARVWHVQ